MERSVGSPGAQSEEVSAESKVHRLRLAVAARNFGAVPVLEALEKVTRAGFDACDNFNWRDAAVLELYREGLERFGLRAGVLVVN